MALDISQTLFNNTIQVLTDAIREFDPELDANNGSVIHLLIVRPLSYLAAKLTSMFSSFLRKSSLQTLSTSQATDTQLLDLIASNFMVTRKSLQYASGYVTLILREPSAYIPSGMRFNIALHVFSTSKRIYIAPANYQGSLTATLVTRIVAYPMANGRYSASIPVSCTTPGQVLIGSGATVQITWSMPLVQSALLLSPISGGADVLTDALLVSRLHDMVVMLSHTTARVLSKRLLAAPYPVLSCAAVGGVQLSRAAHNYLGIARGGMLDVYIKTYNQPLTILQLFLCATPGMLYIDKTCAAGAIRILSVRDQAGNIIDDAIPNYTTDLLFLTALLARLSSVQAILIHSEQIHEGIRYILQILRMPGLYLNQLYILQPEVAFIGLSILLHSAIPVTLDIKIGLDSLTDIDDDELADMRRSVANIVNRARVGQAVLNISDIDKLFGSLFPGSTLRAPCAITAHIPTRLGSDYTFTSLACVIDISLRLGLYTWDTTAYYYCTTPDKIEFIRV